jgi:hypothetical protein
MMTLVRTISFNNVSNRRADGQLKKHQKNVDLFSDKNKILYFIHFRNLYFAISLHASTAIL